MKEDDLVQLRQGLEGYFKLLAGGHYDGQAGVTDHGEGEVSVTFQHLCQLYKVSNEQAFPWISKVLRGLQEFGYFWAEDEWVSGDSYAYPARMFVHRVQG